MAEGTVQSQALIDRGAFVTRHSEMMAVATVESLSAEQLSLVQDVNSVAIDVQVTWETAAVGTFTRDYTLPLVYEEGRWRIVWNEGLILPELAGGNRLVMEYKVPARADLYDRNGLPLAYQGTVLSLGVVPGEIEDEEG
mgnify:CR=1 FL=1